MVRLVFVILLLGSSALAEDFSVLESARETMSVRQHGGTLQKGKTAYQRRTLENLERESRKEPVYKSDIAKEWAIKRFERKVEKACRQSIGVKNCQ